MKLWKQRCMAAELRGGKKEFKVGKEVSSIDSPSGMHFSPGILMHTCLHVTAA